MSSLIENTGDTTSGNLDSIDSQLDKLKTVSRFYKDLFKKDGDVFDADAGRSLDEIQFALDRVNLDLVSGSTQARIQSAKETVKKMQQLRDQMKSGYEGDLQDVEALKAWLELRYEQLEQLSKYGESLLSDFNYILTHAAGDAIGGVEDFGDDLERVEAETNTFIDIVRINQRRIKTDMESMDEELTRELDILSWNMDTLSDNLKNNRSQLRSQKNKIKDQIDRMQDTITDGVDRLREDRDFFEDISDLETQTLEEGMVYQCANYGAVFADYQAGGIIGIIGTESGLDPELDLEAEEERTLNVTRNMKAIVSSCINRQEIQVKNDYAGGIVGKANLGALIGNQNYGDIVSEDGSFAGGITGSSAYILRNNYNMCRITGKDYTGGIAGWGTDLLQNYSMVSFGNPLLSAVQQSLLKQRQRLSRILLLTEYPERELSADDQCRTCPAGRQNKKERRIWQEDSFRRLPRSGVWRDRRCRIQCSRHPRNKGTQGDQARDPADAGIPQCQRSRQGVPLNDSRLAECI